MAEITDVEWLQMKLVYAALYVSLDLIELHHVVNVNWYTRRRRNVFKAPTTVSSDDYADDVSLTSGNVRSLEGLSGKVSLSKRFVEVKKLIKTFKKALGHIPKAQAVVVWRWLCRQSSDLIVLRYIRQNKASYDVVKAIATTIKMQATSIRGPQEMYRGEQFYINVKPDPIYINRYEIGRVTIIGVNKQNQPIILIRSAIESAHESKKQALRRAAEVVCEIAYMCQDEGLNGSTILFDMSGYSLKHMDRQFAAYMGELQNTAFPGMCAKVYIWDAPKLFRTLWGAVKRFYDAEIQEIRTFTRDPKVLLETIDADQLPPELGGTAKDAGKWTPPRETDDLPVKDVQTRQKLLEQREALLDKFQTLTCSWLAGESNMDERKEVLEECKRNYFELDPYVRRRTMFDRNGVMGRCRPEFAPGGIAQPVCGIDLNPTRAKVVEIDTDGASIAPSVAPSVTPSVAPSLAGSSSVRSVQYHSFSTPHASTIPEGREARYNADSIDLDTSCTTTPSISSPLSSLGPIEAQGIVPNSPTVASLTSLSTGDCLSMRQLHDKRSESFKSPEPSPYVAYSNPPSPKSPVRPIEVPSMEPTTPKSTVEDRNNSLGIKTKTSMGSINESSVSPKSPVRPIEAPSLVHTGPTSTASPTSPTSPTSPMSASSPSSTKSRTSNLRIQTQRSGILKSPNHSPIDARIKSPLSEGMRSSRSPNSSPSASPTDLTKSKSSARARRTSIILMKPLPSLDPEQLARDRASASPTSPTGSRKGRSERSCSTDVESSSSVAQKSVSWDIPTTVIDI